MPMRCASPVSPSDDPPPRHTLRAQTVAAPDCCASRQRKARLQAVNRSPMGATEPLPMEYLWYPYIIKHGITLLVGDPGRGKSLFAEYIAALISRGGKLPLSEEWIEPRRVLFLSAENDWQRTILARLLRAG